MRIGIDLGTTFSAGAYVDAKGVPQIIINQNGGRLTPSVVMEDADGTMIVGEEAKENEVLMGESVIATVKDVMGTNRIYTLPSGSTWSPEQISAFILKKIRQDASRYLGTEVTEAVITVPAYFTDAQRTATRDAGRMAGLTVIGMLSEPTAAALYYASLDKQQQETVLVYDLGGGTFDASIVEIAGKSTRVIATGGIRKLGGHFFDQVLLNYVADQLLDQYDLDLYDDEYLDELQELSLKAEACKIQLSTRTSAAIVVKAGKVKERIEITREQFEGMIKSFYERTESTVRMVLDDAHMTWNDIDKLLLVGGSGKIPYIAERLQAFSGKEPSFEVNPDEAVALGAALYADGIEADAGEIVNRTPEKPEEQGRLEKSEKPQKLEKPKAQARSPQPEKSDRLSLPTHRMARVRDVCSHSLGIISRRPGYQEKYNCIIIPRNSELPVKMEKEFYTPVDGCLRICIEVTEGEDEDLEYVSVLSKIEVKLPPQTPKNTRVTVEMSLNENQLLHVYARIHVEPEIYKEAVIPRKGNLTEEELEEQTTLVECRTVG